jgi:uncharacterized membrane protein YebE (DUF533 family)
MTGDVLEALLRGVLGGRPKRSRNALGFLTGRRGGNPLTSASTLLAAAGVAWGIYETMQNRASAATPSGGNLDPSATSSKPTATLANLPPLPRAAASTPSSDNVVRLLRLAVSAAHADGVMSERERAAILLQAKSADAAGALEQELVAPTPLQEIVAGVTEERERATLYVLAYTILRADEQISGTERIYLAQLAHLLDLDPQLAQTLEKDTGDRIDALGDQGQLGG